MYVLVEKKLLKLDEIQGNVFSTMAIRIVVSAPDDVIEKT